MSLRFVFIHLDRCIVFTGRLHRSPISHHEGETSPEIQQQVCIIVIRCNCVSLPREQQRNGNIPLLHHSFDIRAVMRNNQPELVVVSRLSFFFVCGNESLKLKKVQVVTADVCGSKCCSFMLPPSRELSVLKCSVKMKSFKSFLKKILFLCLQNEEQALVF